MTGPSFRQTFGQVIRLRFRLFSRQLTGRGFLGGIASTLVALCLSGGLGVGSYLLFSSVSALDDNPTWMAFAMSLYFFLIGLFWVLWPVVAAQIDEAYELGRFFAYPVRPGQLYLVQMTAGLAEPSVLFFYPALIGAGLGLHQTLGSGSLATLGLMLAFTFMNVAAGRCVQNMFLNVMKSRRSAEILFALFLAVLGLSAFLPPVDASWLFERLGGFGTTSEDLRVLARTARALGSTPPGWLAMGLAAAAAGRTGIVMTCCGLMLVTAAIAWMIGLVFLKRFYRGGRGLRLLPSRERTEADRAARPGWRVPGLSDAAAAVFEKEIRTFASNPKARLLLAVPFFLLILFKIIGGHQLFMYLWGDGWAAVLLALLGLYVLSVLSGQFFANGFGYDGPGVKQTFLASAPPRSWLFGRNLAQGLFAVAQFLGLATLLFVLMPSTTFRGIELPLLTFPFGLFTMLGMGNWLSARFPRRFHLSLARRDRPVGVAFLWVLATLGGCTMLTLALLGFAGRGILPLWAALVGLPFLGAAIYRMLIPVALRTMRVNRERIIELVARPV
jgi:ABC-2 type transport system permease protein